MFFQECLMGNNDKLTSRCQNYRKRQKKEYLSLIGRLFPDDPAAILERKKAKDYKAVTQRKNMKMKKKKNEYKNMFKYDCEK